MFSFFNILALCFFFIQPFVINSLNISYNVGFKLEDLEHLICLSSLILSNFWQVLLEPGTPQGSSIISQMRSHILWMEKRKCHKAEHASGKPSENKVALGTSRNGAFVVAPCPHDGACPLVKTGKYCHFVQRLARTSSQRSYKRSKGEPLRGFEDEKFSFVAFKRGQRPREAWPLDGMKFETLKEQKAKRKPGDLEFEYVDIMEMQEEGIVPFEGAYPASYDSDASEIDAIDENNDKEGEEDTHADLGGGWGRIIFNPVRRGKQVGIDVCRSTNPDGSEGSFERVVITQRENPTLHHQAKRSLWGDLWPF